MGGSFTWKWREIPAPMTKVTSDRILEKGPKAIAGLVPSFFIFRLFPITITIWRSSNSSWLQKRTSFIEAYLCACVYLVVCRHRASWRFSNERRRMNEGYRATREIIINKKKGTLWNIMARRTQGARGWNVPLVKVSYAYNRTGIFLPIRRFSPRQLFMCVYSTSMCTLPRTPSTWPWRVLLYSLAYVHVYAPSFIVASGSRIPRSCAREKLSHRNWQTCRTRRGYFLRVQNRLRTMCLLSFSPSQSLRFIYKVVRSSRRKLERFINEKILKHEKVVLTFLCSLRPWWNIEC